ncbi:sorting nexin [Plakobranchus ocellatus]|uniref:Sorting nexin n=1 Tax=Plakobranchus ocellatus TaxID=259542 RepID=A0AAV3XYC9_9GAST|nr:sorting nexin [Plakobranchus ocellatus]
MSEFDAHVLEGKDGELMAAFGEAEPETSGSASKEPVADIHDDGDPNTSIMSDEDENRRKIPVQTSTPVPGKDVCLDSTIDADTAALLPVDLNERDCSEGTDGDQEESEGSCQYNDDDSQDDGIHREANIVERVMSLMHSRESLMVPGTLKVPIIGYETMEARSKFTIYKIHVMMAEDDAGWFVFRRYSDFVNLNDQLKELFPNVRLALPPKRWFRSNFDPDFLQDRKVGLQEFLENVTGHRDICTSDPVRDFFCFDDPPSAHDSLEESRAQCECLEEMTHLLRKELAEKEIEMDLLKEEIELYKNQVRLLTSRLSEYNKALGNQDRPGLERSNSCISSPSRLSMKNRSFSARSPGSIVPDSDLNKSATDSRVEFSAADGSASVILNKSAPELNPPSAALSEETADVADQGDLGPSSEVQMVASPDSGYVACGHENSTVGSIAPD